MEELSAGIELKLAAQAKVSKPKRVDIKEAVKLALLQANGDQPTEEGEFCADQTEEEGEDEEEGEAEEDSDFESEADMERLQEELQVLEAPGIMETRGRARRRDEILQLLGERVVHPKADAGEGNTKQPQAAAEQPTPTPTMSRADIKKAIQQALEEVKRSDVESRKRPREEE